MLTGSFVEQMRVSVVTVFHVLHRRFALEG